MFWYLHLGINHEVTHVLQISSVLSDTYSEGGTSHRRIQAIPNTNNFMVSFGNAVPAIKESAEKTEDPKPVEHNEVRENVVIHGNVCKDEEASEEANEPVVEVGDVVEANTPMVSFRLFEEVKADVHKDGVETSGKNAEKKQQNIVPEEEE